jgi:peptide deformylase
MHPDIQKVISEPLKLQVWPQSPILRQCAQSVEMFDDQLNILTTKMLAMMRLHNGVGLAAPQIGLSRRIIVIELSGQSYCMVNPEISLASDWDIMEEGCLSLPGKMVSIKRHKHVQIQGQDTIGKPKSLLATGLLARAFQHEIDHLNGVMICDYETQGYVK